MQGLRNMLIPKTELKMSQKSWQTSNI